ncbi:h k atpase alpha [Lasallia pustulata]|uniref:H k atpase alpha n=1 Tax=Lasallia pustulata TaxID=136370 RepID=A0A1W5CY22_9LECA|nr:h k atpase alpha [Lasallia pustulata]
MAASENDKEVAFERRIRYADDEEAGEARGEGPKLSRQLSAASHMSISSVRSRRRSIAATALPIHYRTLSDQLGESKGGELAAVKKVKNRAEAELDKLSWHIVPPNELFQRLSTSPTQGLSAEQVRRKTEEYGRNSPSPPPSLLARRVIGYLFGGFGAILLAGSILVFISWKPLGSPPAPSNLALAIVLVVVFIVQAGFNAWQDWSSSRVMASITSMLPENCLLLRDGNQTQGAPDVVPGDVLYIKAGNKLPADVRFIEISSDAKFDRSILTGESMPISGTVESTDDNYLETHCIGMQGTHCISGSGLAVVVATGDRTVFGRIAKLTGQPNTSMTTLEKEILRVVLIICSLALSMIILVIILWGTFLHKEHPSWIDVPDLIVVVVTVAVAFIPEGLPIALTASLTITANIMRQNKILCKSLKTVETLGAVSVICSDKTGTLTKNQMYASEYLAGTKKLSPESARDEVIRLQGLSSAIEQLRAVAGLCNAGEFDAASVHLPLDERKVNGDATDQAVLRFSELLGSVAELRRMWKKRFDLAFNSKNKFMIRVFSLVETEGLQVALPPSDVSRFDRDEDMLLMIKGAPDVLIGRCNTVIGEEGAVNSLNMETRAAIEDIKNAWSTQGKRVILLARKVLPAAVIVSSTESNDFEREAMEHARTGLTLVGLIAIVDPLRDEIPEVVRVLWGAGIRIFMVTGDFKLTAQAIAQECGIISNPTSLVDDILALSRDKAEYPLGKLSSTESPQSESPVKSITLSGPELITLNDNQWDQLCLYDEVVFARTTPEQKLRIVKELQKRNNTVGMTGDGVNDAPSLKAADIGIALGSGSNIAIEASDMVLLDSFSAIVEAVLYGRVVFDNLKKTVIYLLPAGSFCEFWPVMTNVIFGLPQILSSFLMIVICCFTDCAAATALAYERPEADVMLRPPRNPKKDKLVDWKLLLQAYGFLGFQEAFASFAMAYWYAQRRGVPFGTLWFGYGAIPSGLSNDSVTSVLNEASSIYFVNLVVMQSFNLMAVRTRRLSIFQHPPAFNKRTQNLYLFPAIIFAVLVLFFFLYVQPLQKVLDSTRVPVEHFFLPMAFGIFMLFSDETRKWAVRKWPKGVMAKLAW